MPTPVQPTVVVIFGANGDLTWRKLLPALWNLHLDGYLPAETAIIGMGRGAESDGVFQAKMRTGVDKFSRQGKADPARWADFSPKIQFLTSELGNPQGYNRLRRAIEKAAKGWGVEQPNLLFYLSVAPSLIQTIVDSLDQAGLVKEFPGARIVVEKPFGHDLQTARDLTSSCGAFLRNVRSTGLTTTSARKPFRISSPSASPTHCLSPSGIATTLTMCKSRWRRRLVLKDAVATTKAPARCVI